MAKYSGVHRQQLFHWIGGHIDAAGSGKLKPSQRDDYIDCLRNALKPDEGLWAKIPRDPDFLGDGSLIKVRRPITCFTEWSLTESLPHTSRYGRLGLGFPKRFVLDRGGQPVAYVRDKKNNPYTRALLMLARWFEEESDNFGIPADVLEDLRSNLDFITHFNKSIQKLLVRKRRVKITPARRLKPARVKHKAAPAKDVFSHRFGRILHFLEEREWRIVYDESLAKFYNTPVKKISGRPDHYLKFVTGKNLFTIVLPDNATLNSAIRDKTIREALYPKDGPHVTLLSYQDIGTF